MTKKNRPKRPCKKWFNFRKDNAGKIKELQTELPPLEKQLKESTKDYNVSKKQLEEARTVQNRIDGDKKKQETLLLGF